MLLSLTNGPRSGVSEVMMGSQKEAAAERLVNE